MEPPSVVDVFNARETASTSRLTVSAVNGSGSANPHPQKSDGLDPRSCELCSSEGFVCLHFTRGMRPGASFQSQRRLTAMGCAATSLHAKLHTRDLLFTRSLRSHPSRRRTAGELSRTAHCNCASARMEGLRCPTSPRSSSPQHFALPCQGPCRRIAMDTTFSQPSNRRHPRLMPPSKQQQAPCPSAMANCFVSPAREASPPIFSLLCTCPIRASPVFRRG